MSDDSENECVVVNINSSDSEEDELNYESQPIVSQSTHNDTTKTEKIKAPLGIKIENINSSKYEDELNYESPKLSVLTQNDCTKIKTPPRNPSDNKETVGETDEESSFGELKVNNDSESESLEVKDCSDNEDDKINSGDEKEIKDSDSDFEVKKWDTDDEDEIINSGDETEEEDKRSSDTISNLTDDESKCNDLMEMDEVEQIQDPKTIYKFARRKLGLTNTLDFVGREEEIKKLTNIIQKCLEKEQSGSIYISGIPGSGKSACLNYILNKNLKSLKVQPTVYWINCVAEKDFWSEVLYYTKSSGSKKLDKIKNFKSLTTKNPCILIMDEIDQLSRFDLAELYSIPTIKNSKLILIGIANEINLGDKCANIVTPEVIRFNAYDKAGIVKILKKRLTEYPKLFDEAALEYVSASTVSRVADVRVALKLCDESLINTKKRWKNNGKGPLLSVTRQDVSQAITKLLANHVVRQYMELPFNQKLLSVCLGLIATDDRLCEPKSVYNKFNQLCKSKGLNGLDWSNFFELLQSSPFVTIEKKKKKL